ncbi:interferon-induced very large GTPase 1-like isoform X3 [Melanotaenia boesemani]|uniref:interferon-induced very large GTPase 1-like isoform X3 n=1 Tax=Melanotaenia boesemani TaxID=1250792 RepID=UPI001C04FE8D|nr:interferon-induced very large GTPase 1-like isoform X3 [Melanotaenia boesemani]
MEENKYNPTRRGKGESETKSVSSETNDEVQLEERTADSKCDPVNEPLDTQLSGKNYNSKEGEDENISAAAARSHRVMADLTLVLTGDPNAIKIGSENFLLDHDEQKNVKQFSNKLYDLCGRQICVINMLGLPNVDKIPLKQAVHAFILLIPNGQHNSHYRSGIEWLERTFGKECLSYVMTVLTYKSDEKCESALADLKANHSVVEQRYHTCRRSMMNVNEIIDLLEKIDVMVSENNPQCHNLLMIEVNKDQKMQEDTPHKEVTITKAAEQMKTAAEIKQKCKQAECDVEDSEKNDEDTAEQPEIKPGPCEPKETAAEQMKTAAEIEQKCNQAECHVEDSEKNDEDTEEQPEIKPGPCEPKETAAEQMKTAAEIEQKCNQAECHIEDSEKKGEDTAEQPEIKPGPCEPKETAAEQMKTAAEIQQKFNQAECDVEDSEKNNEDTAEQPEIKPGPCESKETAAEQMKTAAEIEQKCNQAECDVEDSEKNNEDTAEQPEIKPEPCEPKETAPPPIFGAPGSSLYGLSKESAVPTSTYTVEKMETGSEIKLKCDPPKEHGDAEHSKKNEDGTAEHPETKPGHCESKKKTGTCEMDLSGNKQSKILTEEHKKEKLPEETEILLCRLHLQDSYQQKMSPADFLKIGPPVKQSNETCEKDLAQTFCQMSMMLDYRARYIPARQDGSEVSQPEVLPESDSIDTDDDDAFWANTEDSNQSKQAHVHPMDVQMAAFHCSDSFLKQNMITKLSQCQYALPLLVPDPVSMDIECPLWTFRKITKTWKKTQGDLKTVTMKSMPVCKAETPLVSFFRLGSLSLSKSQLMNTLINDRHSTFFHRNCPGSTKSRHLMDGVAEIAWYCPAGKPTDSFTDCVAFCNLHGDSLLIEKQREILTEKSSVIVLLLPTLKKSEKSYTVVSSLLNATKPLICLITDSDCGAIQAKPGKYKLGLKDRSQSDVSEELKQIIGKILSGPHTTFQLESLGISGIRVDENDSVCQKGKSAAMEIVKMIEGMDISKIKEKFLSCEGQLWHNWCRINKELYHLKGNIEKEKEQKKKQLMEIRQKQCDASCSELMKSFTKSLLNLPSKDKEYFLKWTQILIDGLSTDDLSSILQNYDETWSKVLDLKRKHDKSAELKEKQAELEHLSKKLQSATFGLEHIFREMGQIYEAHKSQKKQTGSRHTDWVKYPELAADVMISGYPMELMDGDAGHVPLTWISSLLQEVIKKLGDQRVFVLSVLGVQSSGKSTMLNAMFGLQFAVSAGRCTKGAYMQLLKLSEEIKNDYMFDYVLVVDTEGLHALELAGNTCLHHDNELATFVVGVGNMTLINIFGENPADMQDVLQIVVQAIMRMKKVKLSPSCVFVHQNVTDVAAVEKNMDGKRRLQEKLDKMAQLAAEEEVCDVECFSDVIAFDVQKDVKYFAQLWEGSPPMAPPNPSYSESVQELKNIILSKASNSTGILLSHFSSKIQDLWNALMNEHFVFSFKNTQEIAAYRRLEVQYSNWTWTLRSEMLKIENQLHLRIVKGQLDKIENSHLSKEMNKTYEELKKQMVFYFEDDRDKEILVQWQGQFENKIKEFHEEHIREVKRKLDEVIQQKNARKKLDNKKTEFENKLLQKSKELAHQLKDVVENEEELKEQFDSVWSYWVAELTSDIIPIKDINLEEDQFNVLEELGTEWNLIMKSREEGKYKELSEVGNYFGYITLMKYSRVGKALDFVQEKTRLKVSLLTHDDQEEIRFFINNVEQESLKAIQTKPVATQGYTSTYLQEVAKNVQKKVTEFESERKYIFKKEFTVNLLLYVFDRATSWLLQSHKTYKENNDALTYLNSKKNEYYIVFKSYCKGSSSAVVFGEMMCERLKVSAVEAVIDQTAVDLAGEMRCSLPAFNGNRLNLEKHVLTSLAEKEDFSKYKTYIQNPKKQVEAFIKEEAKKYIFTKQKEKEPKILKKNVDDINKLIKQALFEATDKVKKQEGNIDMWVKVFSSSLNNKLTLDTIFCQNFRDINNFDFLKEKLEKGLKTVTTEMSRLPLDKVMECRQTPDQILIDQLCNCCWERCPFCAAVCTNTLKDHSPDKHNVPFHRPSGVSGFHTKDTVDLVIDFCTTLVGSDRNFYPNRDSKKLVPYKQYPTAGDPLASWRITADESKLTYWKWFVCHFQKELEDSHNLKFQGKGEIPNEWKRYSKEEAIESLDEMCKQ